MSRQVITALSFPVLLLLYFLYGWAIVPLVLPERTIKSVGTIETAATIADELTPFLSLFDENNWELNPQTRPKILRNNNTIVLFQQEIIESDVVRLQPCTFIILPEEENLNQEEQCRRAIVMRTNEMAEIKFDDDVNFSKFPLPKMIGGRLLGKVTIKSGMKEIGTQDDLIIETSDIAIVENPTETLIYAIKDNVKFKLGLNSGEGSRMTIALKADKNNNNNNNNKNNDNNQKKPQKEFAVMRLETLKFLNLIFPEKSAKNKTDAKTATNPANNNLETIQPSADSSNEKITTLYSSTQITIPHEKENQITTKSEIDSVTKFDVTCQREFIFEIDEQNGGWTAAFNGNVEVIRTNPNSTKDFLNGELMHINFQPESNLQSKQAQSSIKNPKQEQKQKQISNEKTSLTNFDNLQPAKMEVFGKAGVPARLRSVQGGGLIMEGDRILYDIKENLIAVETALTDNPQEVAGASPENPKKKTEASDSVKITLQNRYAIQSELGFLYTIGKSGEFGILNSSGKGRLDGLIGNAIENANANANGNGNGNANGNGNETNLKQIHLTWNILQISPEPNNAKRILFDLRGGVTLDVEDFGKMTAEILQLWCNIEEKPTPPEKNKSQDNAEKTNAQTGNAGGGNISNGNFGNSNNTLIPESAIVLNNVHFENQNGTCDVQRLNIFFNRPLSGNNVTKIMQSPLATIQMQHSPISQAVAIEPSRANVDSESSIKLVQYNQLQKRPEQFMPYMPPVVELPRPNGIIVAQNNPLAANNFVTNNPTANNLIANPSIANQSIVNPSNNLSPTMTSNGVNANGINGVNGVNGVNSSGVNSRVTSIPQPEVKSVRSQNLLGFQPSNPNSIYAITGDQMEMSVLQGERTSQVQRLWIGGNVRIVEKVNQTAGNDLIEITGEEVYVWYPSAPNTVIYITGKDMREAIFTGKGAQIRAMHVYIFRAENVIKIVGAGRLLADAKSKKASSGVLMNAGNQTTATPTSAQLSNNQFEQSKRQEGDSRILVQWNKEMYFDGNIISFKGVPDKNGNRVLALMEDREIHCDVMQIFTNRYVSLFDDKSDVTIKPERVGCAIDVVMKSEKFENGLRKSFDWAEFDAVEIRLETDEFFAKGPGLIRSTFLETDNAFSDPKNGFDVLSGGARNANVNNVNNVNVNNRESILFLCIWFYDHIQGMSSKTHKSATMRGHIDAVLCPVSTWDERVERDQLNLATKKGYLLKCEELRLVQMPDPVLKEKNFVELTAIENATIEGENRSLYGRAQTIKFNQAKSQVTLEGNELNNARITTSSQGTIPAQRIEYNLKNGTAKIVNSRGVVAGN
ncbi:MAG: hypothetical protein LBB88_10205 [Planctomycetaceae bacterium]|nr:hypothetical protein [Planctomycetaceae bacterium]